MRDISGFGTSLTIVATQSFPIGFNVKDLADDTDPIDAREVELFGYDVMFDGSLFSFDKGTGIEVAIAVIPGSESDINLKILLQAKKGGINLLSLPDVTSMLINYPDGGRVGLTLGTMISGPLADSVSSSGRRKSNVYKFVFGGFAGAQSAKEAITTVAREALSLL